MVITNRLAGGYYEFGVYKGESFRESYRIHQGYVTWHRTQTQSPEMWRRQIRWEVNHHFYAFDTFAGMPANTEENEVYAQGSFLSSLDEVRRAGQQVGMVEGEQIRYFKGTFAEIASAQAEELATLQPAVIVNIDSDLCASAADALAIVRPKLQQGTILLMDDWNCFGANRNKGERRALREFLENYPEIEVESWFPYSIVGQAFIVHLTPSS